jgi:hypothetical protein
MKKKLKKSHAKIAAKVMAKKIEEDYGVKTTKWTDLARMEFYYKCFWEAGQVGLFINNGAFLGAALDRYVHENLGLDHAALGRHEYWVGQSRDDENLKFFGADLAGRPETKEMIWRNLLHYQEEAGIMELGYDGSVTKQQFPFRRGPAGLGRKKK